MASGRCMNVACGAPEPGGAGLGEWRRGWRLRSGGFATLCIKCGMAYDQFVFCNIFHQKDSGWRECSSCGKRLHCGCIASKSSFDLLDTGGVQCIGCIKNSESSSMTCEVYNFLPQHYQRGLEFSVNQKDEKMNDTGRILGSAFEMQVLGADRKSDNGAFTNGKNMNGTGLEHLENDTRSIGHSKWEKMNLKTGDVGIADLTIKYRPTGSLLDLKNQAAGSPMSQQGENKDLTRNTLITESLSPTCLSMSLGTATQGNKSEGTSSTERKVIGLPQLCTVADGREQNKSVSMFQQMQKAHCYLPKPPKAVNGAHSDGPKDSFPNMRVARPPAEGRCRSQLLPRYWPRITDQELQQISGDSNSTIVPLFEKVLSASDAGRIGRLVLPKACAEAYFPPISQPEGLPLTIQDAKGKDWHFQFRFWPNNNSRMYVLEGVTPCIQSLQLQAGDTVTFSRIDPEGKLVMGYRKATNNTPLQDSQICTIANGGLGNESFFTGVNDSLSIVNGYSGLFRQAKGNPDVHLISQPEHISTMDGDISWFKASGPNGGIQIPSYKRSRNIGASKRLLMDRDEAFQLKVSWEEAQDLLRPPPSAKPSIVMIEDHEVEEYEEPPIFGKKTIFTAANSGEQDQWVQCDDCSKWRRIPVDILLSSKWTCVDNAWDPKRCSCSAANELSPGELEILLQQYEDLTRRSSLSLKPFPPEMAASGLDALASAVGLGDVGHQTSTSIATTTKHPRHRPGCTCIVCIQPPSGKGPKHNPNCTCNVCMTVKRRFKTLMMRKKKRQSEREEAEANKKIALGNKEDNEGTSSPLKGQPLDSPSEVDVSSVYSNAMIEKLDADKGHIDLNCDPGRDENPQSSTPQFSMLSLLQVANRPLETYMKQNGLTSLACEQGNQESPSSIGVPQAPGESEDKMADESQIATAGQERVNHVDEGSDDVAVVITDVA